FASRTPHTRCSRDWSSDVCSSDLGQYRRYLGVIQSQGLINTVPGEPWHFEAKEGRSIASQIMGAVKDVLIRPAWNLASMGINPRSEERRVGRERRSRGEVRGEHRV